ncbi:HPr family phosphocarrier protein [Desulfitobacterium sp. AusDCA]|uniref:HPr family phosphocarrier protein n=1 Tax=Desulfitobacterium sp. AusDCA TaxID=3240383 RepID=UPI003DA77E7D
MLQETIEITNKTGLHARPASMFVKKANTFTSKVMLVKDTHEIDAKSMISLLTLGAAKGDTIIIKVDGSDEKEAIKELVSLLQNFQD